MTDLTFKELAKAGVLFLIMGVAIWVLYSKVDEEITILRIETKECSENYKDLLLNQLHENTKQIERNNDLLLTFNRKEPWNQK